MTEAGVVEAVRELAEGGRAADVAGAGSLLSRISAKEGRERIPVGELRGIVRHDAADLTVTVRAGTRVEDLTEELAASKQDCPIEGPGTTVGGRVACGLSGIRRLGVGHIRQWVLGGRLVTGTGERVRIGAGTVKNVTGYDLPRILCGSWGTLGVLTEITLRVRPRPTFRAWYRSEDSTFAPGRLHRPSAVVRGRDGTSVLLEGHPEDCAAQALACDLGSGEEPSLPGSVRVAIPPDSLPELLDRLVGEYAAEAGVGLVHADPPPATLPELRALVEARGGRLMILDPEVRKAAGLPAFGSGDPAPALGARIRDAFDPAGVFSPWRFRE